MITAKATLNVSKFEKLLRDNINKKITPKVNKYIAETVRDSFRYAGNKIFAQEIARFAPSPSEEAMHLTHGMTDRGKSVGEDTSSYHFMKNPEFMYLQDAILQDAKFSVVTSYTDKSSHISFELTDASKGKINQEIGFAWMKKTGKNSLERRSTKDGYQPFWGDNRNAFLLENWEYGTSYKVTPRDSGDVLTPDYGVHAKVINKVIPPHRMFYLGMKSGRAKILALVKQNLTKRAK